jgi:hypothetical protein
MNTLFVLSQGALFTLGLYLVNASFGKKEFSSKYIVAFFFFCGTLFAFQAHAEIRTLQAFQDHEIVSDYHKRELAENMAKSEVNAKYHYNLAKSKCWYLPDIDDREKARHCFNMALGSMFAATPQSKIVGWVIYTLSSYGLACLYEWNDIEDNLMKSKVWWECYEFYKYALENSDG